MGGLQEIVRTLKGDKAGELLLWDWGRGGDCVSGQVIVSQEDWRTLGAAGGGCVIGQGWQRIGGPLACTRRHS